MNTIFRQYRIAMSTPACSDSIIKSAERTMFTSCEEENSYLQEVKPMSFLIRSELNGLKRSQNYFCTCSWSLTGSVRCQAGIYEPSYCR